MSSSGRKQDPNLGGQVAVKELGDAMMEIPGYQDGSWMYAIKFSADCQERLASTDYKKLAGYLYQINSYQRGGSKSAGEDLKKLKDRAREVLSGDKYLLERFDGFFNCACSTAESFRPQVDEPGPSQQFQS